ncbi:MAG: MurR/RpiR family transcriptional regulator [Synergistaceae bacterium]|jgi:DNA-binding MurR/RpiR family transcriptional regulator|nr:MurR/RpiR family transcriptional regulator [Synergistaceae bacterium]
MPEAAEIFNNIRARWEDFSASQRKIAEMILNDYAQVINMSSPALAKALSVSPSTVVRFASALGYESYPKMLQALRESLISAYRVPMKRIHDSVSGLFAEPLEILLEHVVRQELSLVSSLPTEKLNAPFQRVASFMAGARNIVITGARASASMAQYAGYLLGNLYKHVQHFPSGVDDRYDRLEDLNERDMVLCISFQRYCKTTVDVARFARKKRAFVAGITDYAISPLIPYCTETLFAPSDNALLSTYIQTMVLLDSLICAFIKQKGDSVKKFLDSRTEVLMQENIYEDIRGDEASSTGE